MPELTILKLNSCFIFVYLYHFEIYGKWQQINSLMYFIPKNDFFFVYVVKYAYI